MSRVRKAMAKVMVPLSCVWHRRTLVWQLTRQEIVNRYRGSLFGILWSFFTPIVYLVLFTFVFSIVFEARWDTNVGNRGEFALVLFAGFIVFWLLNDCLARAPMLVVQNTQYVKKVIFPLEVLPWPVVLASLFHALTSVIMLVIFQFVFFEGPHWTLVLVPVVLLPFVLLILGLSWFAAALGVFFRDLPHLVTVVMTVLLYTSTIIYPISAVPEPFATFVRANPLTFIVEQFRTVVLWGDMPAFRGLAGYGVVAWGLAVVGYGFFGRLKRGFANVL